MDNGINGEDVLDALTEPAANPAKETVVSGDIPSVLPTYVFPDGGFDVRGYVNDIFIEFVDEALRRTNHSFVKSAKLFRMPTETLKDLYRMAKAKRFRPPGTG